MNKNRIMKEIKSKKELDKLIKEKGIKCHKAVFNGDPKKDYYYYYTDSIHNLEYKISHYNKNITCKKLDTHII